MVMASDRLIHEAREPGIKTPITSIVFYVMQYIVCNVMKTCEKNEDKPGICEKNITVPFTSLG